MTTRASSGRTSDHATDPQVVGVTGGYVSAEGTTRRGRLPRIGTISATEWTEDPARVELPAPVLRSIIDRIQLGETEDDCHLWTGTLERHGYGVFTPPKRSGIRMGVAHRFVYAIVRGPIPAGLTLDHLCYVPRCVNPWHMEPVTQAENVKRAWDRRWQRKVREIRERNGRTA